MCLCVCVFKSQQQRECPQNNNSSNTRNGMATVICMPRKGKESCGSCSSSSSSGRKDGTKDLPTTTK